MSKLKKVLIYSDNAQIKELYSAGKAISDEVAALFIGKEADAAGAETVYYLGDVCDGRLYESYLPAIIKVVEEFAPDAVLFSTSVRCRMMAAVVAARFGASVMTDAGVLSVDGAVCSNRMVYGGSAIKTEKSKGMAVVCLAPGSYEAAALPEAKVVKVEAACAEGITRTATEQKVKNDVNLAAAKKVVCVGRGCASETALAAAKRFAELTGCEMGCTRPVAEDGLMPSEQYVGISGAKLKPNVYFGFGISGQVQHLVGVNSSRTMFVINKDKKAPFFKNADFGLIADVETALPKLIAALEA